MSYTILKIPTFLNSEINKLNKAGIFTSEDLIDKGYSEKKRIRLSVQTSIDLSKIRNAVYISDLIRIKGIGIRRASDLLIHSIFTVSDLSKFKDDPEKYEQLTNSLKISQSELSSIISYAAKLRPQVYKLQTTQEEIDKRFKDNLQKDRDVKELFYKKMRKYFMLILSVGIVSLIVINSILIYGKAKEIDLEMTKQFGIDSEFFMNFYKIVFWQTLILAAFILLIFYVYLKFIINTQDKISQKLLIPLVIRNKVHRVEYIKLKMNRINKSQYKGFEINLFLFLLLVAGSIVLYLIKPEWINWGNADIIIIIFLVILFINVFRVQFKSWSGSKAPLIKTIKKRVFLITSIEISLTTIITFLTVFLVFLPLFKFIVQKEIEFVNHTRSKEIKNLELALFTSNQSEIYKKDAIIHFDSLYVNLANIYNSWIDFDEFKDGDDFFKYTSIVLFFGVISISFVFLIPYVVINGYRNAGLFILSILVSLILSEQITSNSKYLFLIKVNSTGYYILLFSFTLLIVTFSDIFTEMFSKKVNCENCSYQLDDNVNFCPNCGIKIES